MKVLHGSIIIFLVLILILPQTVLAQKTAHEILQERDNMPAIKLSHGGAVLIIKQTVDKLEYKMGEGITVHPEMIDIGNSPVFVANGLPLFHIEADYQNGTKAFDSGYSGMLIVGWGFTLDPGLPISDNGTWGSYPTATTPIIKLYVPGKYNILSESNIQLYDNQKQYYGHPPVPEQALWSQPLQITVLPEKYVNHLTNYNKTNQISLQNQTTIIEILNGTSFAECKAKPCLIPDEVTVKAGSQITWYNHDRFAHTVTSGKPTDSLPGTIFDSGVIPSGGSFNYTFSSSGNFSYFDEVRPWITGNITVNNDIQSSDCTKTISDETNSILNSVNKQNAISLATNDADFRGLVGDSKYIAGEPSIGSEGTDYNNCRLVNPNIQIQFNILGQNANLGNCPYVIVIENQTASKVIAVDLGTCSSSMELPPNNLSALPAIIVVGGIISAAAVGISIFVMRKKK